MGVASARPDRPETVSALRDFAERAAAAAHDDTGVLDAAAAQLFGAFASAGVEALLLKGPVLARVLYPAEERRTYVDVDVLVAPSCADRAREVLLRLGYAVSPEDLAVDDIGGVVHSETWVGRPPRDDGASIDVHHWLAGGRAEPQLVWDVVATTRQNVDVNGRRIAAPGRAALALHIATHAAQHGPGHGKVIRDLELALERWSPDVWIEAAELARRIDALDPFAAGLRLVPRGAQAALSLRLPATPELDWEVRNLGARPRGRFHLHAFREARTPAARLAVLRRALLPPRDWLVRDYPWAWRGGVRLRLAYLLHVLRAPLWALRAASFGRRRRRVS